MELWQILAICGVVFIVLAVIARSSYVRKRSRRLQDHFGAEYDRLVAEMGNRRRAEAEMMRRKARFRELNIEPLSERDREEYLLQWESCQARFVDDPGGALLQAERLVTDIVSARGYPTKGIDDRFDAVSAAYPELSNRYREASAIAARYRRGDSSTEDLRMAFIYYRALSDELLEWDLEELKQAS